MIAHSLQAAPTRRFPSRRSRSRFPSALATFTTFAAATLAGCAGLPEAPPLPTDPALASAWHAALPHSGSSSGLARWWQQFDDPLLDQLVVAADRANPTAASAASRLEQARAARTSAGAALLPSVDGSAGASRGRQDLTLPGVATTASAALQASWELDVFGRARAGVRAADARLAGADAGWHDARVTVAAETANSYVSLRACEARLAQARLDANSRAETARLTGLSTRAGFESRANASLALASAAQARTLVTQQAEQCEQLVKSLVALTAIAEPDLRSRLAAKDSTIPEPATIAVPTVPAAALAQRPDVHARDRDLAAASADVSVAEAARLPQVAIAGSVGVARYEFAGAKLDGTTWSLGPLSVSLPVFDAGRRNADVRAARARYDEAAAIYAATLRSAVREVEVALVALQSAADRQADAAIAADHFDRSYRGVEARYKSGFATLFELEDARRSALVAQNALIDLRRERVAAWISLYRALGGGWRRAGDTLATNP